MRSTTFTPQRVAMMALMFVTTAVLGQHRDRDEDHDWQYWDGRQEQKYDRRNNPFDDYDRYPYVNWVRERPVAPYIRPSVRPSDRHIWVEAEWVWRGGRYVFLPGYWTLPRKHMHYVPGYWHCTRGGWIWVQGYWTRTRGRW